MWATGLQATELGQFCELKTYCSTYASPRQVSAQQRGTLRLLIPTEFSERQENANMKGLLHSDDLIGDIIANNSSPLARQFIGEIPAAEHSARI